jgi:hypothetical protein
LRIPFVRVIALIIGYRIEVMVSGGSDLARIKVQPMRCALSLALALYARYLTPCTRL